MLTVTSKWKIAAAASRFRGLRMLPQPLDDFAFAAEGAGVVLVIGLDSNLNFSAQGKLLVANIRLPPS